ncbi:MAG: serine/threonine protein kinase [Planctomycetes bacterium]|jgi:serine/threonine protein kinase|nr:serine/threonine protein kinase [Planctomycetota bacterium]HON44276.1 serine/threonine-protein kinase [Planctomycetota bacterium]HPY75746.1 serine/threonine-protein kinase [Planctomycetota bacterium]HQB01279.1 serine/threonine-protein kinase [Planctomycetota bacterium]HRU51163.1 serine/threonine-protein kinase [Planctomycetota bacterium]
MNGIPTYFGEIALQERYIDENILHECLELQKICRQPVLLGEIFVQKGFMDAEHVMRILKLQENFKNKLQNEYLAHILLKKKLITSKQLQELRRKYAQEVLTGNATTFANLAIEAKILNHTLVENLMKDEEYVYIENLKKQGKTSIAGYELVGKITQLRKAEIYKAIQVNLDRLVSIKALLKEFETTEQIQEFFKEAKITSHFNHPNLVRVYDTGLKNDMYYYAMEFVEGENLSDKLQREGRLQVGESLRIIRQVCQALEHIHNDEYIHGQVNPRNIVLREDKVVKVLDLRYCCKMNQEYPFFKITQMPQYMAPEQFLTNVSFDQRTDIYCLGVTFYRMLTGKPAVTGKTIEEIKVNVVEQEPTPIQDIDFTIPEPLAKIVHRMMRKDPAKRYPDIRRILFALKKILV